MDELLAWKRAGNTLATFAGAKEVDRDSVLDTACEILVPAARPDAITEANVDEVATRLVLEGANIPVTAAAEMALHRRGVLCLPDWIVNAGGVICASVEYAHGSRQQAFDQIADTIWDNTANLIEHARARSITPRAAAEELALARVHEAQSFQRPWTRLADAAKPYRPSGGSRLVACGQG
jgi:glutamate dehydrogenase (NAD(P)+)